MFVPSFVEIGPMVLEKKVEWGKVCCDNNDDSENNDRKMSIRKAHLSLLLR